MVDTVLQDFTETLFENGIADVLVFEHVAEDEKQWFHVHVLHIARLDFGEQLV